MRNLFPLLVVLFVVFRVISAIITASKKGTENEAQADETEEQKRMREIQERIRKKIAERRGGVTPLTPPAQSAQSAESAPIAPPTLRPVRVPPLDPFGGPAREFIPFERRAPAPTPVAAEPTDATIMARQERLAEEMRVLEAARRTTLRRAAEHVAEQQAADVILGAPGLARASWRAELRNPASLRRAMVLREVLGPPVGLR
jgi:hypothetical protein